MKRILRSLVLAALLAVLSGCTVPRLTFNPQELYTLPELPAKYTELNALISAILDGGAEYAAPASGTNIQPVQLVDLDGDGGEEAVAFFQNANEEKPLKIYIFSARENSYEQTDLIEGSGSGIYSIAYNDLDGDGMMELLVGWKTAPELQVLEVYAPRSGGTEALVRTDYVKYTTTDLNGDQRQELVVLRADEEGEGIADYYNWQEDGGLASQSPARISVTMAELSQQGRVSRGTLQGGIPALFVTGVTESLWAITDVLTLQNGELTNIALSGVTGVSDEIAAYCGLYPTDINGDGLTETPFPTDLLSLTDEGASYRRIDWYCYDADGQPDLALRTYHSMEDGWYLQLPEDWRDRIWVSRTAAADEAAVTFYILDAGGAVEPFLRITAITGANRETRAVRGTRFLLSRQSEIIYTAELLEANDTWQYGVTADGVRAAFSLIAAEWTAGDY